MKILILGNIGSGKTTLAKEIEKELKIKFIELDVFRMKYGDGTIIGEYLSFHHFFKAVLDNKDCIFEFTGAGYHKEAIRQILKDSNTKIFVILLTTKIEYCEKRIENRKINIPLPSWNFNTMTHMKIIERELENDYKNGFWIPNNDFILINYQNNEDKDFLKIKADLISKFKEYRMKY